MQGHSKDPKDPGLSVFSARVRLGIAGCTGPRKKMQHINIEGARCQAPPRECQVGCEADPDPAGHATMPKKYLRQGPLSFSFAPFCFFQHAPLREASAL